MRRIVLPLAITCFIASSSGCITLKLSDSKPGSRPRAAICEKRTAVLVLEDKRTVTTLDRRLEENPAAAVSRALADKLREYCPDSIEFINRQGDAAERKPFGVLTANDNFDFLLTGNIDRFVSNFDDKYQGLRMAGAITAGLTIPVGLVLLPFLYAGYADHVTDVDFTLSLVDVPTGAIIWTKRSEFRDRERITYLKASGARIEEKLNKYLESATSDTFTNISSAYMRRYLARGIIEGRISKTSISPLDAIVMENAVDHKLGKQA